MAQTTSSHRGSLSPRTPSRFYSPTALLPAAALLRFFFFFFKKKKKQVRDSRSVACPSCVLSSFLLLFYPNSHTKTDGTTNTEERTNGQTRRTRRTNPKNRKEVKGLRQQTHRGHFLRHGHSSHISTSPSSSSTVDDARQGTIGTSVKQGVETPRPLRAVAARENEKHSAAKNHSDVGA